MSIAIKIEAVQSLACIAFHLSCEFEISSMKNTYGAFPHSLLTDSRQEEGEEGVFIIVCPLLYSGQPFGL